MDTLRILFFRFRPLFVLLFSLAIVFGCAGLCFVSYTHMFEILALLQRWSMYLLVLSIGVGVYALVYAILPKDMRKKKKNEDSVASPPQVGLLIHSNRFTNYAADDHHRELASIQEEYERKRQDAEDKYQHDVMSTQEWEIKNLDGENDDDEDA